MNQYELAQLNVAELVAPLDSVELTDFVANLEGINALADSASGFVWRLQTHKQSLSLKILMSCQHQESQKFYQNKF